MTPTEQILKTLKNRLNGMVVEATRRNRQGLKQQVEELGYLIEMLEKNIGSS